MKVTRDIMAALAVASLGFLGTANAQDMVQPSADEIQDYAAAVVAIQDVMDEYRAKIAETESQSEQEQVREEYRSELVDAVKAENMSVERYNEIFEASQANPQLAERINEALESVN